MRGILTVWAVLVLLAGAYGVTHTRRVAARSRVVNGQRQVELPHQCKCWHAPGTADTLFSLH